MGSLHTILQVASCKKNTSRWFLLLLRTKEYQEHSHHNLQEERQADKNDEWDVEGKRRSLLHDGFQLGRIGHQQGNVQHALRGALLICVVVDIHRSISLKPRRRSALQLGEEGKRLFTSLLIGAVSERQLGPSTDFRDHPDRVRAVLRSSAHLFRCYHCPPSDKRAVNSLSWTSADTLFPACRTSQCVSTLRKGKIEKAEKHALGKAGRKKPP